MGKTGIVISYHLNKTYIAKVLCENKEEPQMQCNGKCQLKKQLVAEETKKENEPVSVEKLPEVFWTMAQELQAEKQYSTYHADFPIFSILQFTNFPSTIFHPPATVA